ncbi:phage regulatory protein [Escherichia coli]|uniref:Phage regulatory protein n=1 Tax=Escherichia coli TaxID=562 RepID=A0A376L5K1_ECOLX|nr:phage regulatory protein [Escherichia coli]
MKIKHEHIRMAMNAWARPDGEKSSSSWNNPGLF